MDYYSILGIDKNASSNEIKLAYKKMALLYHPDRNKSPEAENQFKNIANAYQILSDPQQRILYDNTGNIEIDLDDPIVLFSKLFPNIPPELLNISSKIIKQITDTPDFNINTIKNNNELQDDLILLTQLLSSNIPEPIKNLFHLLKQQFPSSKTNHNINYIDINPEYKEHNKNNMIDECVNSVIQDDNILEQNYKDDDTTTIMNENVELNNKVDNTTSIINENVELNKVYNTTTIINENVEIDNKVDDIPNEKLNLDIYHTINIDLSYLFENDSIITNIMVLKYCKDLDNECNICSGKGYYLQRKRFKLPLYYREIKLKNEGHQSVDKQGDLYVSININNSSDIYNIYNDFDLVTTIDISIYDIYFGNTIYIPHFNKNIGIRIPKNFKTNVIFKCIDNLGLPKNKNENGNLYLLLNIVLPENIPDEIIEQYFPTKIQYNLSNHNNDIEIYRLE